MENNDFPKKVFYAVVNNGDFLFGEAKIKDRHGERYEVLIPLFFQSRVLAYPDDFGSVILSDNAYIVFDTLQENAISTLKNRIFEDFEKYTEKSRNLDEALQNIAINTSNDKKALTLSFEEYSKTIRNFGFSSVGSFLVRLEKFSYADSVVLLDDLDRMPEAILFALGFPFMLQSNIDEAKAFVKEAVKHIISQKPPQKNETVV